MFYSRQAIFMAILKFLETIIFYLNKGRMSSSSTLHCTTTYISEKRVKQKIGPTLKFTTLPIDLVHFHLIQYLNAEVHCFEKHSYQSEKSRVKLLFVSHKTIVQLENKRDCFTIGFQNLIVPKIIHKFLQQTRVFISTSSRQKTQTRTQ